MHAHKPFPDPSSARGLFDEADIGSGEKSPAQLETEALIREIPPLPPDDDAEPADDADPPVRQHRVRHEQDASLERDEPSADLDELDPVPPKGN